jgi:hypothetical protein
MIDPNEEQFGRMTRRSAAAWRAIKGTNRNAKCLGERVPDTFDARSAHLTGLKMMPVNRAINGQCLPCS